MEISGMRYELTPKKTGSVGGFVEMSSITNAPGKLQTSIVWQIVYCNAECETKSEGCGIVRGGLNYGALRVFIAFGNHTGSLFIWRSEVPYGIVFNKHICSLE
jgi:hypothetical protein